MFKCISKKCFEEIKLHGFFIRNNFYEKMSLKNLKMLRKSADSNAWAAIYNHSFFLELFKSYKME